MTQRLFLIDASNVLYRYYHAMKASPRLNSAKQDIAVVQGILSFVEKICKEHKPEALAWVEDAGDSGRGQIDEKYKSGRVRLGEEEHKKFDADKAIIAEFLEALRIPVLRVEGYEADDVMATMAKRVAAKGWTAVMVGHDKDLYQVVEESIHILVPGRGGKVPVPDKIITPANAKERLGVPPHQVIDYLSLVGDGADTVPGVKGIGEKGAIELLEKFGNLANILARVSEVTSKRYRTALETQAEQALVSQKLVSLILDVPIPKGLDLRMRCRNEETYQQLCGKHEMRPRVENDWAKSKGAPKAMATAPASSPAQAVPVAPEKSESGGPQMGLFEGSPNTAANMASKPRTIK